MEVQHIRGSEAVPQEMAKNDGWIMKMVNGLRAGERGWERRVQERCMCMCLC